MKTTHSTKTPGGIQITAADLATPAPRPGESFLSFLDGMGTAPTATKLPARKAAPKAAAAAKREPWGTSGKPDEWWSDAGQGQLCY